MWLVSHISGARPRGACILKLPFQRSSGWIPRKRLFSAAQQEGGSTSASAKAQAKVEVAAKPQLQPQPHPNEKNNGAPEINPSSTSRDTNKATNIRRKLDVFTDYYGKELWTIPNIITYARMFSSPFLGLAIVYDYKTAALVGCSVAAFSDWLDGYIAKNYDQMTVLGGMIDPAADKLMIGCLTAGIAWKGLLPVELCALILGRDVLLLGCSFALRAMERPTGTPFFDTTYSATFEIIPSNLSKFNTIMQFGLLAGTLCHWGLAGGLPPPLAQGLLPLQYVTAATTLGSLVGYLDGSAIKRLSPSGVRRGRGEDENERDVEVSRGAAAAVGAGASPSEEGKPPSPPRSRAESPRL